MPSFLTDNNQIPAEDQIPSYLLAADNHNIGNTRGGSWLDPETWGQKFENAGKMIATGMLSGANSFYNTGITVGNWFGAEASLNDTKDWISSIDSDMGKYYDQNREAADLIGFIAGSLIPGLGGIKILNAGQTVLKAATKTGLIGTNLSKATGLLIPQTERYIATSAAQINSSAAAFSSINANTVKALASGFYQNALEGAAFEVAVQATMFKSPILEKQDGWDISKNILLGAGVGGVIGGVFTGAATLGAIKKSAQAADIAINPTSSRVIAQEGQTPAHKIILMTEDLELGAAQMAAYGTDTPLADNFMRLSKAYKDKVTRTNNAIRTEFNNMVKGEDSELGNMITDASFGLEKNTQLQNLLGAEQVSRIGGLSKGEKELNKAAKAGVQHPEDIGVSYVKLTGKGIGEVADAEPAVINLADRVTVSAARNTETAVLDEVRTHKFSADKVWNPLARQGKNSHFEAEARHIWASKILKEVKEETTIHQYDIPLLERALEDGVTNIKIVDDANGVLINKFNSKSQLWDYIVEAKQAGAAELLRSMVLKRGAHMPIEEGQTAIAKIMNVSTDYIEGSGIKDLGRDMKAWQTANEDYVAQLASKGLAPANKEADTRFLPTYAKITRRAPELTDVDGNVIDGMTYIKQQEKQLQTAMDNVYAKNVGGDIALSTPNVGDSVLQNSTRTGNGATLLGFANGGYGSPEAITQFLGSITKQIKTKFRQETADALQGPLYNLGTKQEAAIEFSTIQQKITRSAKQWVVHEFDDTGEKILITTEAEKKFTKDGVLDFDSLSADMPEATMGVKNPETMAALEAGVKRSSKRTDGFKEMRAAQGLEDVRDSRVIRPIRPNPNDYQHFAFVKDPRVTGQGHTTMIFAADEKKLAQMIDQVPNEYTVLTKKEVEEYKLARNEYESQRTLHENYIDQDLKNRGIMSEFFTKTDPQKIVNDILQQNLREDDVLAIELMRAKNQKAFAWWEDQGSAYSKLEQSKFGTYSDRLEGQKNNPYLDYIKTSLDISKASENPLLFSFNRGLDKAVSRAYNAIEEVWTSFKGKTPDYDKIDGMLAEFGMSSGYKSAAVDMLANHTAPKGELTKFVRGANAILSRLTLGLDPLNAVNNFVGANVLRGTELKQLTDAIKAGDTTLAGELGKLTKIDLPGGVGQITSPTKLVASSVQRFFKDLGTTGNPLATEYRAAGFIKDATTQFRNIVDDFTLRGTETVGELQSRLSRAMETSRKLSEIGEKYTGNRFVEEFNRFISADVVRQITDLGVSRGLLSKPEQLAYINTFVNRVEGNVIASQRPLMFQGPVGQAIGLFQSYQFNLMQQLFRYVGEGGKKDAAMLLGLQGTFYGIQGLPAFQFINQHIIGSLSGNQKHIDAYDATYGIAGRQVGDLLMYGLPSNLLQANLYSRGDINPRHLTVLPTSIPDIPFVSAFGKFLGSVKDSVSKISQGAPVWESLLQGLEHNGLSRPLAGLAQTLQATGPNGQVYSTTGKGSILFSNDLMSWATAVRLTGGRPLDEAIVNDGVYRIQSYQQLDRQRMLKLAETVKASVIQGNTPSQLELGSFAQKYVENGGKQAGFNKYMMSQFKAANTPRSQEIVSQLQNPFAHKMQLLMGGGEDAQPIYPPATNQAQE